MTRRLTATTLLLALAAACGGGGSEGNAAVGRTFSYGPVTAASTSQQAALQQATQGALALRTVADPSSAQALSDGSDMTTALLGTSSGIGLFVAPTTPQRAALVAAGDVGRRALSTMPAGESFDNPGCVTTTATSFTLRGCSLVVSDSGTQMTITADGTASLLAGTLTWDFRVGLTMSGSGYSGNASARRHGSLTATASTLAGEILTEVSGSVSGGGRSESLGVSESVQLDLTYSTSPDCITGGTIEAKRVWTQRPSGTSSAELPDGAARAAWSGCGIVTVSLST